MATQAQRFVYILCIGLLTKAAFAQPRFANDPTGLYVFTDETGAADFTALNDAELSAARRGMRLDVYRDSWKDTQIDVGFDYEYTRFEYRNVPSRNRDLHRAHFPIRLDTRSQSYRLNAYVAPGIATSSNVIKDFLRRGTGADWYLNGGLELSNNASSFTWILGAGYDRAFGEDQLYPVLGIAFQPNEDTRIRLAYPVTRLTYDAGEDRRIDLTVFPAGQLWHVQTDDFDDEFDYEMQAWRAQLALMQRIWKRLSLDIAAGYEFDRDHRFEDSNSIAVIGDVSDAWFFRLGVRISFTL
ncbi:MAG: DUF6268 family outer membrane beta-barrel protein [Pseudomonadota bacterium]